MKTRLVLSVAAAVVGAVVAMAPPALAADSVDDSAGADTSTAVTVEETTASADAPDTTALAACVDKQEAWGWGCFKRSGDAVYVLDTLDNGQQTYVYWENYLLASNDLWKKYRAGRCYAPLPYSMKGCKYNFYEWSTKNPYGGKGSGLRIWVCETGRGCGSSYKWVRNNQ